MNVTSNPLPSIMKNSVVVPLCASLVVPLVLKSLTVPF